MSQNEIFSYDDNDRVPSYEESASSFPTRIQPPVSDQKNTPFALGAQVAQTRARRISQAITDYVEPLLLSLGPDGVLKKAFILVPSDVLQGQALSEQNLVSSQPIPTSVVRMEGDSNLSSFWQQRVTIDDFASALKARLVSEVSQTTSPTTSSPQASFPETPLPPRPAKKSWMRKTFGPPDENPNHDPTGSTGKWTSHWQTQEDQTAPELPLGVDEVGTRVRLKDVSFRTETEYGLLATDTVKCVWLEIEIGV